MTDVKIYTITSDDLSPPIEGEGFCTDMVRHSDYAAREAERDQLAAENASLTKFIEGDCWVIDPDRDAYIDAVQCVPETPATDAWQREQRQKAWAEGINYTAGRLAAAFNHGHINKPLAEVGDIVRMILTTKEDLANDPGPAADGLSGEYAEKALEDWEQQQLRAGVAPQKPILSQAITDIIAERQRQKEKKGYTESRDDNYLPGVLNLAGAAYAVSVSYIPDAKRRADRLWPWPDAGKYLNASSKDPRSALIKAAALITAEIERIDRAELRNGEAV